jgi:hypothetical protein
VLAAAATGAENAIPLELAGAAYVRIRGLTIEGATGPSTTNVYATEGAHDIELSRCSIRDSARQGFFSERSTSRIRILGCRVQNNGGAGPEQLDHDIYMEGRGHVVAGNLITGARNGYGVQLYPSSDGVLVAFNTIAGNAHDGVIIGSDGSTTTNGATVVNNVIAHNGRYAVSTYWGGATGHGNVVRRNVVWGNGEGEFSGDGAAFSDNLVRNPRFVDEKAGDYRLRAGSPALGRALPGYVRVRDLDGRRRPEGRRADLGAYERGP